MKATGLVCEYNPFHNGHLYHLNKAIEVAKDNAIIVVLSSHFTQRGEISILDKFEKTKIAIKYGADIVIELPFAFSTQSGDKFAKGSIELLHHMKVESIVFGSESNDIEKLKKIANKTISSKDIDNTIKSYLKMGLSYPKSVSKAYEENKLEEVNSPNDILGICYIREILKNKYNIKPITIQRTNDYHSKKTNDNIISATAVRNLLNKNKSIKKYVPLLTYNFLKAYNNNEENYFKLLKYKINSSSLEELKQIQDVDEGLENRIKEKIKTADNLDTFINSLKTKRYTRNKITRMLAHIIVNYTKEENDENYRNTYVRILGFSEKGKNYLNKIKKNVEIPIITNYKNINDNILKTELKVTRIYEQITNKELINQDTNKKTIIY